MINRPESEITKKWQVLHPPLVSVVCITYNHHRYISDALDGFLMQETDFPFEIVVHDDASTDGTAEVIRQYVAVYPTIVRAIFQTENQYSKGVPPSHLYSSHCRGEFIAWCEGDDYWTHPKKLQVQADFLRANPQIVMHGHGVKYINELTDSTKGWPFAHCREGINGFEDILERHFKTPSIMYRNDAMETPEFFWHIVSRDIARQLLLAARGPCYYAKHIMSVHRHHDAGVSKRDITPRQKRDLDYRLYRGVDAYLEGAYSRAIRRRLAKVEMDCARKLFRGGAYLQGIKHILIAHRMDPMVVPRRTMVKAMRSGRDGDS